jgi:hypothetical protein
VFFTPRGDPPFSKRLSLRREENDKTFFYLASMPIHTGCDVTTDIDKKNAFGSAGLCDKHGNAGLAGR